ncbi:MAG: transposase [Gammaproteobacteria bacterium RIFCSPLOWO2_01_FULL_47_190]|nr:MAG: transposase [Gammaproteobacteria bacterium RIFCSPLOWO2_01_FULL_47_190]
MNKLKIDKQASIISALVEGNSIRSTERMSGVHRDTIMRLMLRVGDSCHVLMDQTMRNLPCRNIQVDEIWGFVGKKQRHIQQSDNPIITGDQWTYVALDSDTKLVPVYLVGKRNAANTHKFINDLSSRLANRVQLSSDALKYYVAAAEASFGGNVDYGQIVKSYEADAIGPGRYSPPHVIRAEKERINGNPDLARISTSHVERQNLTMRMSMRRFTRLTNAFSKKLENLKAAVSLHFAYYNFCRVHASLRVTPAMETGLTNRIWTINDLLGAIN